MTRRARPASRARGAERHHDVALADDTGTQLAKRRITDDAAGYRVLLELLAEHGDTAENSIPVAIETSHGLLVAALRTGTRRIYAVNPLSAARYRDRHSGSRKKSGPGDAIVLANIMRTDMAAHQPHPPCLGTVRIGLPRDCRRSAHPPAGRSRWHLRHR